MPRRIVFFSVLVAGCHVETKAVPRVPLGAEELANEWKTNKNETLAKYKDKLLEISGIIATATNDTTVNLPLLELTGNDANKARSIPVKCFFTTKDAPRIDELCEGQRVKVRGQLFDAEGKEATVLNCELVEAGESPELSASPRELVEEYEADKDKMAKKYDSRWLVVEGFIDDIERPKWEKYASKDAPPVEVVNEHCYRFFFKTDAKQPLRVCAVCCSYYNDPLLKKLGAVSKGQKIKVRGRCDRVLWRQKKRIELTQGVLLE